MYERGERRIRLRRAKKKGELRQNLVASKYCTRAVEAKEM